MLRDGVVAALPEMTLGDVAKRASVAQTKDALDGWKTWLQSNIEAGARNAHSYTKLPVEWSPTTVIATDGVITAGPMKLLEHYKVTYEEKWRASPRRRPPQP